ncbi:MAG: hypothetical protein ACOC2M_04150 [bacterium]
MAEKSFSLEKEISLWTDRLKADPSFTDNDIEELRSHFYDLIDSLKKKDLSDEEALLIAKKRIGENHEVKDDFAEANRPVIQMRRSLLILAGVLVYFLGYYFIFFTSKLLIIFMRLAEVSAIITYEWLTRYMISWLFVVAAAFISIYFREEKTIRFIEKLYVKPKHTIIYFSVTVIFAITDTSLFPIVKNILDKDRIILGRLYQFYNYFNFAFPFLLGLAFIFIYYKYYKKAKI